VRSESLDRKETELVQRQKALEDLKAQADQRLQELKNARAALEDMVSVARTAAEKDVSQLVSVYESMKPKEAARVFQQMPPEFAAGFLSRMQPEAAASIVANLEPTTAYSISVVLAGRNVDAAPN
jgi:flagellar motility protein MotE (MotC chaperone)